MLVSGTFTLSGGTIDATIVGGTIDALLAGTVTVNGGTISTVSALTAGTVTVQGGTIDALLAGTVTVNGGTISTVSALTAGTVTVQGGTIQTIPAFTTLITATDVGTTTLSVLDEDTSLQKVYSYYVVNLSSTETVTAWLEISPTDVATYFVSDSSGTFTVGPTDMAVLVAKQFLNYTRLRLVATASSSVECYYNAQS